MKPRTTRGTTSGETRGRARTREGVRKRHCPSDLQTFETGGASTLGREKIVNERKGKYVKRHSIETKAKVLAHLKTGASVREAAEAAGVPVSTAGDIAAKGAGQIRTENGRALEALLLGFVEEILAGNSACARLLTDEKYLRQQKPHELAVLAGELMDRAFKILEAMERAVPGSAWRRASDAEQDLSVYTDDELRTLQGIIKPRGVVTVYELPENGRDRS